MLLVLLKLQKHSLEVWPGCELTSCSAEGSRTSPEMLLDDTIEALTLVGR